MSVRAATIGDTGVLAPLLARLPLMERYGRDATALARDLADALARGDGLVVAEEGGELAGLAWFMPRGAFGLGAYLRLIALVPGRQGHGVGVALLAAFEQAAAADGRHAFLLVSDFNHGAQRFYARQGYSRVGTIPGLVLPDVDEIVYWKRLR